MRSSKLASIVLPVYKQADHIGDVVREYETSLSQTLHELILVVNGGRDASLDVCRALEKQYETVRTTYSEHTGWGHAVKLGLKAAKGDVLCYTNAARTHPSDLKQFIHTAIDNPAMVVKARRHRRRPLSRKLGSLLYNLECRALFALPTWDVNGTPKVFGREVYTAIDLQSDDDLIDLEFNIKCKRLGVPMLEIPIDSHDRHSGRSTTDYSSALRMYREAFHNWKNWKSWSPRSS